jgi:hypothetical protein
MKKIRCKLTKKSIEYSNWSIEYIDFLKKVCYNLYEQKILIIMHEYGVRLKLFAYRLIGGIALWRYSVYNRCKEKNYGKEKS